MKVIIDRGKCLSNGNCVMSAPTIFTQDEDDALVLLLKENPDPGEEESARDAVRRCPVRAISVVY